jgi:hypothetical protein
MTLIYILISEYNNTITSESINIMQMFNFTHKIKTVLHHPSIIKSTIYRKRVDEIRLDLDQVGNYETMKFISYMK